MVGTFHAAHCDGPCTDAVAGAGGRGPWGGVCLPGWLVQPVKKAQDASRDSQFSVLGQEGWMSVTERVSCLKGKRIS